MKTIAVLGGGVAGLTVAHELAERGFGVTIYERRTDTIGGKARSEKVTDSATGGRKPLPGEHGFRFFPGFYKHIPDTMRRIPFGPAGATTVFDNLVPAPRGLFAMTDKPSFQILMKLPTSLSDLKVGFSLPGHLKALGLTDDDFLFFVKRLLQVLTSCQARRLTEYDLLGWWDFIGAPTRSTAYQLLLATGLTRNAVATQAHRANARTISDIAIQLMQNMSLPGEIADRVLTGPTNEAWLDAWFDYLTKKLGVDIRMGATIDAIGFDGKQVTGVTVTEHGKTTQVIADAYVCALPLNIAAALLPPAMATYDPSLRGIATLKDQMNWMTGIQFYLDTDPSLVMGHINCIDSPWALTAISQKQFWPTIDFSSYGDGTIKDIVSVDISDWYTPAASGGPAAGKRAIDCSREEIAGESWRQLYESVNGGTSGPLTTFKSWWLDNSIQASSGGPHKEVNLEPLLVNEEGAWALRPDAATHIPNLVLAGDYVRTFTDFASMESANEAGRRAANVVLARAGYDGPAGLCSVWPFHEPDVFEPMRALDEERFIHGNPWQPAEELPIDIVDDVERAASAVVHGIEHAAVAVKNFLSRVVTGDLHPDAHELQQTKIKEIFARNANRADPLPPGNWETFQTWRDLMFAHWPVPPEFLRKLVPSALEIDTFEGSAYVSLVSMQMAKISFRTLGTFTASVPGETRFPELNIRTYVKHGGLRGVYFFRADATPLLSDLGANLLFHLPYGPATMKITEELDGTVSFRSHRTLPPTPDATYVATYKPLGTAVVPPADSRTAFVRNRDYAFIGSPAGGAIKSVGLLHDVWQVQDVDATVVVNSVLAASGFQLPTVPIAFDFTREISVLLWNPVNVS